MTHEAWIFRLAVRITGLMLFVASAPKFVGLLLNWIGMAADWHSQSPDQPSTGSTPWDWIAWLAPSAAGVALGLYLLIDGRLIIEGLYPSLRPKRDDGESAGERAA